MEYSKMLSKFAFIFLVFIVITSGYLKGILSCQMQSFLENIDGGKHVLGIVMVFVFIMLEGGWSFNEEENNMADNDWSSGNVIDSLIIGTIIYILFIISSKSRLAFNIVFFTIMFILYLINTQRSYYYIREIIKDETNDNILLVEKWIFVIGVIVLICGFIDYVIYQQKNYKSDFSWFLFLYGVSKCNKLKNN